MAGVIATNPKFQFTDSTGAPLAGGTLTTYIAGTNTLTNTWQDQALSIANTNPITLDSRGECVLWLNSAVAYKFVLKNSAGVTQWTVDNISGADNGLRDALAASSGSSLVSFLQSDTGAVTRTVQAKLQDVVSVKDFGAVGDGVADDTNAFVLAVAAIKSRGRGAVYVPSGRYKITATINIDFSSITIYGDGKSSLIYHTLTNADCFYFYKNGDVLQSIGMQDLFIYSVTTNPTAGALIHVRDANNLAPFSNLTLQGHFGGMWLESTVQGSFDNLHIGSDANFTSLAPDSYLLKISKSSTGVTPAELHFSNLEARGQNNNQYLDYGIVIHDADGVWFASAHVGFVKTAAVRVVPLTTTSQITAVNSTDMFLDTVPTGYGLWITDIPSYTGTFGGNCFGMSQIYNVDYGVSVSCTSTSYSTIDAKQISEVKNSGVYIGRGSNYNIRCDSIFDINTAASGASGIVLAGSGQNYLVTTTVAKLGTATPATGVYIADTVDNVRIDGSFFSCTNDIVNAGSGRNIVVSSFQSSKSMQTINATVAGELTVPLGPPVVLLGTANNVTSIASSSAAKGRAVTLIAQGAVTVVDGSNLKLNGNFVCTADDTITLVCDGTNWYENCRSVN